MLQLISLQISISRPTHQTRTPANASLLMQYSSLCSELLTAIPTCAYIERSSKDIQRCSLTRLIQCNARSGKSLFIYKICRFRLREWHSSSWLLLREIAWLRSIHPLPLVWVIGWVRASSDIGHYSSMLLRRSSRCCHLWILGRK